MAKSLEKSEVKYWWQGSLENRHMNAYIRMSLRVKNKSSSKVFLTRVRVRRHYVEVHHLPSPSTLMLSQWAQELSSHGGTHGDDT
jgi:hypothetical protein